jgi:hypothetical protein
MKLIPVVALAVQLASSPTSPCEQFLSCGTFTGRAIQFFSNLTGETVEEEFEIKDTEPNTVRITERTKNLQTRAVRETIWDLEFDSTGTFKLSEMVDGRAARFGEGTCENHQCTFWVKPKRALAAGSFDFQPDGFSYWISEMDPKTRKMTSRLLKATRKVEVPTP